MALQPSSHLFASLASDNLAISLLRVIALAAAAAAAAAAACRIAKWTIVNRGKRFQMV
jgi:hypothetical protein